MSFQMGFLPIIPYDLNYTKTLPERFMCWEPEASLRPHLLFVVYREKLHILVQHQPCLNKPAFYAYRYD